VTPVNDFPFSDLHSFKDYVGFVRMCTPDLFSTREGPGEQWTLDLAFAGLNFGFDLVEKEKGEHPVLKSCREITKEAYDRYRSGGVREGCAKMRELEKLIKAIPSS
jgi:hypothetical protein